MDERHHSLRSTVYEHAWRHPRCRRELRLSYRDKPWPKPMPSWQRTWIFRRSYSWLSGAPLSLSSAHAERLAGDRHDLSRILVPVREALQGTLVLLGRASPFANLSVSASTFLAAVDGIEQVG